MDEVDLAVSVDYEADVNVEANNVDARSPLFHGVHKIADCDATESLYERICRQAQDDVF